MVCRARKTGAGEDWSRAGGLDGRMIDWSHLENEDAHYTTTNNPCLTDGLWVYDVRLQAAPDCRILTMAFAHVQNAKNAGSIIPLCGFFS